MNLRIAENFSSKISEYIKQCINLVDVREVIEIMGTLNDFKEIYDDVDIENNSDKSEVNNKLYRDSSNRSYSWSLFRELRIILK